MGKTEIAQPQETQKTNAYGLTEDQIKTIGDIVPTLSLEKLTPETPPIELEILNKEPKELTIVPKKGLNKDKQVILNYLDCIDQITKVKVRLFLNSASLKREIYKLAKENKFNWEHLKIYISCRYYDHEIYGNETKAYIVTKKV